MTATLCAGCVLIAYGPSAVVLLAYASRRSALLILTIASAFFWLLSIFVTSIVWIAIPPLKTVHPFTQVVGILLQEAARAALVVGYAKSEKAADKLIRRGGPKIFNDLSAGIAAGLGFGAMHTVMMYGGLLAASAGEAAFYIDSCPQMSVFTWTAVVALLYNVLHATLMIIAIDAYRRWSLPLALVPVGTHLLFGLFTLINGVSDGCVISLPVLGGIVLATILLVWRLEANPNYAAKRQQRAWQMLAATSAGGSAYGAAAGGVVAGVVPSTLAAGGGGSSSASTGGSPPTAPGLAAALRGPSPSSSSAAAGVGPSSAKSSGRGVSPVAAPSAASTAASSSSSARSTGVSPSPSGRMAGGVATTTVSPRGGAGGSGGDAGDAAGRPASTSTGGGGGVRHRSTAR